MGQPAAQHCLAIAGRRTRRQREAALLTSACRPAIAYSRVPVVTGPMEQRADLNDFGPARCLSNAPLHRLLPGARRGTGNALQRKARRISPSYRQCATARVHFRERHVGPGRGTDRRASPGAASAHDRCTAPALLASPDADGVGNEGGASSSRCSAARPRGRWRRARSTRKGCGVSAC